MVDVINNIDLCGNGFLCRNLIFLAVLRLFGKVVDVLFSINFFQCKDLKVISFFWQIIDAVPQKQLQLLVFLPVHLWSKIVCSGTSFSLLSLVCYVPMLRPKAVFLCGRHDRIISTWHRFTIIIYNSRKKVLLFSTNDRT